MKKKQQTIHIQQDQAFLQGINLVTGLKINYDRPVLTQKELNALCINQNYTRKQKAIKILKSGEALQKWSLFQNLGWYLTTPQQYEQILHLIQKYFQDLQPMLNIVASGLTNCLQQIVQSFQQLNNYAIKKPQFILSEKAQKSLFRILMRSVTDQKYNKIALDETSQLFNQFFVYLGKVNSMRMNQMVQQCLQYIAGSFSMNALPQRRRVAFQMMKGLVQYSQKVKERAKTKASFFNNDKNSKTRIVICQTMGKLLFVYPDDQQIRNFILDYFYDEDIAVVQKSFQILTSIPNQKHLDAIINAIQSDESQVSFLVQSNLQNFVRNFSSCIKKSKIYKAIICNLVNSVLKSHQQQRICRIFPLLEKLYIQIFLSQNFKECFLETFFIDDLDFQNEQIFKSLLFLYRQTQQKHTNQQVERVLLFYVQKNLKSAKIRQNFCKNLSNLKLYLSFFTYQTQQQNDVYSVFLIKSIEQSKWSQVQFLLEQLKKIIITQNSFQKLSSSLTKLILHCPYYLVQVISKSILYLLLSKRKHLQLFLSVKQKLFTSKNWIHRKNYIVLYAYLKSGSSYEFHKIVPVLNYKLITKQKCCGVKLQFLKYSIQIYQSIDPTSFYQKIALKQAVYQLSTQKDQDINCLAKQVLKNIADSDQNFLEIQRMAQRNSDYLIEEQKLRQKQALMVKKTRTQKQVSRKDSKSKTTAIQGRTSLKLPKDFSKEFNKKDITFVNVQKLRRSSTVIGNKRIMPNSEQEKKPGPLNEKITAMTRYYSGQMKMKNKINPLRKQSGL